MMLDEATGTYHMYVPLYPAGLLYHPVSLLHGTAPKRYGPWTWRNETGVEVSFNPGGLAYRDTRDPANPTTKYTLWVTKPDGAQLGAVYSAGSAAGPWVMIPNSNSTGCYINPSPLFHDGAFYCTGQKGETLMTAADIGGPWSDYATIPHRGEDPFLWVDRRGNWHAIFHTSGDANAFGTNCSHSQVVSHVFSDNNGRNWTALNDTSVQPYKPVVQWDDQATPQSYATMERPHLYFDPKTGDMTHLGVAAPLNIGDEGCPHGIGHMKNPGCRGKGPCTWSLLWMQSIVCLAPYLSVARTLLALVEG